MAEDALELGVPAADEPHVLAEAVETGGADAVRRRSPLIGFVVPRQTSLRQAADRFCEPLTTEVNSPMS